VTAPDMLRQVLKELAQRARGDVSVQPPGTPPSAA
jgi:hypothetical protein